MWSYGDVEYKSDRVQGKFWVLFLVLVFVLFGLGVSVLVLVLVLKGSLRSQAMN